MSDASPPLRRPTALQLALGFAAVYVIWGSTYLAILYAIQTLPPLLMAGSRFMLSGSILMWWTLVHKREPGPTWRQWRAAAIVGALLLLGGNGLICVAELRVPSGLTALLVATVPLFMALLDWLIWRGPRPTLRAALGLVIGLGGVYVLIDRSQLSDRPIDPAGAALVLFACLCWAVGSLHSRRAALPKSLLLATGMEMVCGGALQFIAGAVFDHELAALHPGDVSASSAIAFAYLVVFGSLIGFSAYIWLLRHASAAAVSTYAYVNPIVAIALGTAFAHEPLGKRHLIAAALIIAAVMLITIRPGGKRAVEPEGG